MHKVIKYQIRNKHNLYDYCDSMTKNSKNLKNASLFRLRNHFTASYKDAKDLSNNEKETKEEIQVMLKSYSDSKIYKHLSSLTLERIMRTNLNPDFFKEGLPKQSAVQIVKKACMDFENWFKSLQAFNKNPSSFTSKPKMPKYCKSERSLAIITNQDAVLRDGYLKLPLTKTRLKVKSLPNGSKLSEVHIKPCSGFFELIVIYEDNKEPSICNGNFSMGIDLGIDNLVAIVSNNPEMGSLLYKGKAIKSCNRYFNKEKARLTSILKKECNKSGEDFQNSHRLNELSRYRESFITDYFHKIASDIIKKCETYSISKIIIGHSKFWKQKTNIGKVNNQNFVSIPFNTLIWMIEYRAKEKGIEVQIQEESYTSKASFLDFDDIPVYKEGDKTNYTFSGKRIKRGLYKSKEGVLLNADINGAGNTLRKYDSKSFDLIKDFSFVNKIKVFNFDYFYKTKKKA